MSKSYKNYSPIRQFDEMACWAASLEWWVSYMAPRFPVATQLDLMAEFSSHVYYPEDENDPNFGGLSDASMLNILNAPRFDMGTAYISGSSLTYEYLSAKLAKGPAVVAFLDTTTGAAISPDVHLNHCNVIIKARKNDSGFPRLTVMEPRTGTYEKYRRMSHYQRGDFIIGWVKN